MPATFHTVAAYFRYGITAGQQDRIAGFGTSAPVLFDAASIGLVFHDALCVHEHVQQAVHGFRVGVEVVIVFRALAAHLGQPRVLKDLQMVRHGRAGKVRVLRDLSYANAAALADPDHLDDELLAVFVAKCQQDFSARRELFG